MTLCKKFPEGPPVLTADLMEGVDWNCLSHAYGIEDHGWGTPAELKSQDHVPLKLSQITLNEIFLRITQGDGLIPIREHAGNVQDHIIAAEIMRDTSGGADYHFYRLNLGGVWSSKMGRQPVLCDLQPDSKSSDFIGYFKLPKTGIEFFNRLGEIRDWRAMGLDI